MGTVSLQFPVLVRQNKQDNEKVYQLQPLFLPYPTIIHPKFDRGIQLLKKEVQTRFRGRQMFRAVAEELFWYQFQPKQVKYEMASLEFHFDRKLVNGQFSYVSFELQNLTFICLPDINHYFFIAGKIPMQKADILSSVLKAVKTLLKKIKAQQRDDFEVERYMATKGSFISEVDLQIQVITAPFSFESQMSDFYFARTLPESDFNGAEEIEKVGYDLSYKYPDELNKAYLREKEVSRFSKILFGKNQNAIALVGRSGSGRHTIVEDVYKSYLKEQEGKAPSEIVKIWRLDPNRVIAGMSFVGMWQKRFESIIRYLLNRIPKKSISDKLLVDNPVALLRIGKSAQNNQTLSDVLKTYLESRELQIILIATPEQWKLFQETDRSFSDLFSVFRLTEPNYQTTFEMALAYRRNLEAIHDCKFSIQAINQLFDLHRNFLNWQALPGGVIKLMNQLAVRYKREEIDAPEVRKEFESLTGLRPKIFDPTYILEENEIRDTLSRSLIGQEKAVAALTDAAHVIKARLNTPGKPLASFLFIGPTGVGKTQAAKALASYLTGSEKHLLRFDMNEYIDEGSLQRLIGDYYHPEGQLTGKVRFRPFSIVLLDEIEKAHPKVHDLLLQLLDDARLTDSLGRTTDFSNTIIIMTSNLGSREAATRLGFDKDQADTASIFRKSVENWFRPEFINRIGKMVIFEPLQLPDILKIARLQIQELLTRDGFVRRTTMLNISDKALDWVARRGFDAKMGGRALKRQIERDLTTLSADQLIATHSHSPILLDIGLKDGRLYPAITDFEFARRLKVNWLPELPNLRSGKRFYKKLLYILGNLEKQVEKKAPSPTFSNDQVLVFGEENRSHLNWQYYQLKDRLTDAKQQLSTLQLGFKDKYFTGSPAMTLRLKGVNLGSEIRRTDNAGKSFRNLLKDKVFQKEALDELRELYHFAPAEFDNVKTEFINSYFSVAILKIFINGLMNDKLDDLNLKVESCITGSGEKQTKDLLKKYADLLDYLDIDHKTDEKNNHITASGYGLWQLLEGEAGIHLFHIPRQSPIPLRISLSHSGKKQLSTKNIIIRLYDEQQMITDFRTGYSNSFDIMPSEFSLMVLGGVNSKLLSETAEIVTVKK